MLIILCPHCGSTSARSRPEVYSSGTSHYSGRSSTQGLSFGLSKNPRPRLWLGRGSSSGKRQSIKAQYAARFPFYPGMLLAAFIYFPHDQNTAYSEWESWGIAISVLMTVCALYSLYCYFHEWMCSRCSYTFTPKPNDNNLNSRDITPKKISGDSIAMANQTESPENGGSKPCSICGARFPRSEFEYGNKSNRSYCRECDKLEKKAYADGGKEAARDFREKMRSKRTT